MAKFRTEQEAIDFVCNNGLVDCSIKTREDALALANSLTDEFVEHLIQE